MRLLLIEDNPALRKAVSQYLSEAGYLVDTSATGDEGLWSADGGAYGPDASCNRWNGNPETAAGKG
jgi:DNA-binding response OmpR family regulator